MENLSDEDFAEQDNSTNTTRPLSINSLIEYRAAMMLWKVWMPAILLLGGFGNIATIFVMRRIKDHNSSQYAILMALAVADFVYLYISGGREWIRHEYDVDVRHWHTWVCKLHKWLTYCVCSTCTWLLTCVALQRTMAVLWPHRMRAAWTVHRTWLVITAVVLTACTYHSHLLVGVEITADNRCDSVPGLYGYFYTQVFMWLDTCLSSLLPCLCIFVCSIILSLTLFKVTSDSSIAIHAISNTKSGHNNGGRRKTASRTTVMVLALSFTFLVLTLPVYVFYAVWYQNVDIFMMESPQVLAELKLVSTMTHLMAYTNSAINFYLYCLTGSKYRREFLRCVYCRDHSASSLDSYSDRKSTIDSSMQLS